MEFKVFLLCFALFVVSTSAHAESHSECEEQEQSHDHYSFKELQEAVNGEYLMPDDVERLLSKLHFWNCSDASERTDNRKCLTPSELYSFAGSSPSQLLNSTNFAEVSPLIVYCLLPAAEKNPGRCEVSFKNHSELFNLFARNFSEHGEHGITHEALDHILEEVNKTIGQFLTRKKCFSAESIFEEIEEQEEEHHEDDEEHHEDEEEEEHGHHDEEKVLNQEDFQKACASIVLHLVQGFCIEESHGHNETDSSLPSKDFFIKDLFKDKKHLSEEDLEEIVEILGIGKVSEDLSKEDDNDDHGHDHRRRRSVGSVLLPQRVSGAPHGVHRRAADDHDDHDHETNGTSGSCYSLDDMLTVFGIDHSVGADMREFKELCPAFIQQSKSGACKTSEKTKDEPEENTVPPAIWGYGFLAVTIISITSLVGVATIPFLGKSVYKKILAMLVALAVGSLAGDSLLHLLPHAFGLHQHEEEGDAHDSHEEEKGFIWKALLVLSSVYAFYLFETVMHLCLKSRIGDHNGHSHTDVQFPAASSRHGLKKKSNCSKFEHHEGALPIGSSAGKPAMENGDIVLTNVNAKRDHENGHAVVEPKSLSQRSLVSDVEGSKKAIKKISTVAWMIIIGDTIHNISDGLAIGAAFSEGGSSGVSGGISTSIAVFCHELPHELGDFAVLLAAGMSVKMALFANLMSAMSCYIGLVIGILIGQHADVRFWIFAIAAGMFLYVALVDMLPDLMHSETLQTEPMVTFLCQNVGLLLGICIMLIIALFEEDLMAMTF
ncbi:metal cation symporter ZIP14-like [Oculina patagonica]